VDEFPPALLRGRRLGAVPRPYDRKLWKQLKLQIGMRDGWCCQVPEGDSICGARARELDHIVPISRGGSWFNPSNLRIACHHHQRLQGGRLGAEAAGWGSANYEAFGIPRARRRRKRVWAGAIDVR
jgi:5-methylcytosine-specific restriction endonuclease McrA